jgi:hypothetical protein
MSVVLRHRRVLFELFDGKAARQAALFVILKHKCGVAIGSSRAMELPTM